MHSGQRGECTKPESSSDCRSALGEIPSGSGSAYTAQISEDNRMSLAVITKVLEGSWKST